MSHLEMIKRLLIFMGHLNALSVDDYYIIKADIEVYVHFVFLSNDKR